ncbi:MAG TPA: beta-L-arabinofuranosidase domain-containing protein [Gemmatimonadaceae bacterium]|nr:beta-L-arabinofuranosidase domain-containing protein [Gemmatimonadaceae bacterium]
MTPTNRREFIETSASAAAALALGGAIRLPAPHDEARAARSIPAGERTRVRRVPLTSVRLTGGPLKRAQDAAATYLLSLDPDRMMAYYRIRAGLASKGEPYGGWDGAGRNLTGHVAGHHLSAVSLMYSATGDARFRDRAGYLVRELRAVQDKQGDGYLVALDGARDAFAALSRGEIRSAAFDLNGLWSPWYTLHKTFAGLRDAYRHGGDADALKIETAFAGWVERVLGPLDDAQLARMLNTEFGGMNEVLTDLAIDTRDDRWLALSQKFEHRAFTDALKRHEDNLAGKHSNCQIPKLIGSATRYSYTGDAADLVAAAFFWDRVVQHHSYATGGNGMAEYFGYPDRLAPRVEGRTCESCCVYNMLKLTRQLFELRPDAVYADYHERALFNHALASFDPDGVRMSYMVPVGRAEQQEYQDMQHDFTCCVGTGMENHALHGDGIYYEAADSAWLNLYAPSTADLSDGTRLAMDTGFPDGDSATLTVTPARPRAFALHVRRPAWAGDGFEVTVNGERVALPTLASLRAGAAGGRDLGGADSDAGSYVTLLRTWRPGDVVRLALPKSLRLEPTPDDPSVAAIMWGPLVLAGDLGPRRQGRGDNGGDGRSDEQGRPEAPALIAADKPLDNWIVPAGIAGDFRAVGVARSIETKLALPDVSLTPFYRTHGRTYSVYFDVLTESQLDARVAAATAERERVRRMEAATLAVVQPGDTAAEQQFGYRSDPADRPVNRRERRPARGGTGWFSYDVPVDPNADAALVVTYLNDVGLPMLADFDIQVDGTRVAHYAPNANAASWWDASYDVPSSLTRGKSRVTVRFQAGRDGRILPVYGLRVVKR